MIVNHTADFDHPALRRMAEHVYPLFDDVVFRDPISAERCASLCGGRFAADTAFWFEPAAREDWAPLAGRPTYFDVWPAHCPVRPLTTVPLRRRFLHTLVGTGICRDGPGFTALIEAHAVRLFGTSRPDGFGRPRPDDLSSRSRRRLGLPLVGVTTPVQQAVDIVGNADAYIGGRWHAGDLRLEGRSPRHRALSQDVQDAGADAVSRAARQRTFDALDLAQ